VPRPIQQKITAHLRNPKKVVEAAAALEPTIEDVRAQAFDLVSKGCKPGTALRICGVSSIVEKRWKELSQGSHAQAMEAWMFFRDLEVTKNKFKAGLIAKIAVNEDWKSAAWLLERQYRSEYGKEITLTANKLNTMSDEEIDRALKQLESSKPA
jgi:hypothetical protein